jgi:MOSC domain-containing protein YiiM
VIGTLEAIWLKPAHRAPMARVQRAEARAREGLAGNANQGGQRQVTLMSAELWEQAVDGLGQHLDPSVRRANLLVRGIDLADSRGQVLVVGRVPILIRGETLPCERMDQACTGLRSRLASGWRGGAYGEILADGTLSVGDAVHWETSSGTEGRSESASG